MSKLKMCSKKVSFNTKGKAEVVASKFNQRVYECPICFCWHTSSKENWKDEFVRREYHERCMAQLENTIRNELNARNKELGRMVADLTFRLGKERNQH